MRSVPTAVILRSIERRAGNLSPPQALILSFLGMAAIGAVLLKLPLASTSPLSWMQALFTSVSATTVTGLVVTDTGTHFTWFGQTVLMLLMQGGGLGLMTTGVMLIHFMSSGHLALRHHQIVREEMSQSGQSDMRRLLRAILVFTLGTEGVGAVLFALYWVPEMGWTQGLFTSVFHAISAFNNAGFALFSNSFVRYVDNPMINIVMSLLIIVGGIGFAVVSDIVSRPHGERFTFRRYQLHTQLMLVGTVAVNLIAMIVIWVLEYRNPGTLGGLLTWSSQAWAAWFQAITPRSAGFNTLDIGALLPATTFFIIGLMLIGGGSGSTASGIKLSTFIVLLLATRAFLRRQDQTVIFGRGLDQSTILKALALTIISLFCVVTAIFLLTITESAPFLEVMFEAVSAFSTAGLSRGITPDLSTAGQIIVMILMLIGRVGPLTLVFTLATRYRARTVYPAGQVNIG